ncbi:unnamed protein product, partial [Brassica napus]
SESSFFLELLIGDKEVMIVNDGICGGLGLDVIGNDEEDEDARNLWKSPRRRQTHGHRSKLTRTCATRVDTCALTYSKRTRGADGDILFHILEQHPVVGPSHRKS